MIIFITGFVLVTLLLILTLLKRNLVLKTYYEWLELAFAILFLSSLNMFYYSSGYSRGDDNLIPQIAYILFLISISLFFIIIVIRVLRLIFSKP